MGQEMHTKILVGKGGDENERQAKAEEAGGKQQGHKNKGRREIAKKTHTNKRSVVRERSTHDDKLLRRLAGHGALAHRTRFRFAPTNASYRIAHDPRAQFCRKHQRLSAPLPTVANTKQAGAPRCTFRTVWAPQCAPMYISHCLGTPVRPDVNFALSGHSGAPRCTFSHCLGTQAQGLAPREFPRLACGLPPPGNLKIHS